LSEQLLISQISNLCDHQRYRRTDGRTDGQTTCDRKTTFCTIGHPAVKSALHYDVFRL